MHVRMLAPALALCLGASVATPSRAQDPAATPAPPKPAPIVRVPAKAATTPAPSDATAPVTSPPKPIHLTVAKPVTKTPPQSPATNADGTPATPKPKSHTTPAVTATAAQTAAPSTAAIAINRSVIVLDPAHGGLDSGSHISDSVAEKDVTLALAFRLRSLLTARGFTVVMTRDNDMPQTGTPANANGPGPTLTLDDRAGIANHAHPVACLLLHATASGEGVHLYSSELDPIPAEPATNPWLTAQAAWVPASQQFGDQLGTALTRARLPLVQSRASIRPVDSLTCPAVVLELAPDTAGNIASLSDEAYQRRVAEAVTGSLVFWQNQAQAPPRLVPASPPPPPVAVPKPVTPEAQP